MNKHQIRLFLCAVLLPLFLVSCGDDDDDDDISPNVSLLTAGEWTGNAVFVAGQDRTEEFETETGIILSEYTTIFNQDGTYAEFYEGDEIIEGNWEFQDNERTIVFDKDTDDEYSVSVTRLDEDELFYIQDGAEFRFIR